jgi:FKBP-type peptidyl-prolyl cis-trans isomerase
MKKLNLMWALLILIFASCDAQEEKNRKTYTREELIEVNKQMVSDESDKIDRYIELKGLETQKTERGLMYEIIESNDDSVTGRSGNLATIQYRAFLLDSTEVAFSLPDDPLRFKIDQDDVVSGLHEGLKLLSVGDSARFILPSHLAYGLTGSENVPPKSALVYEVRLIALD